MAVYAAQIDCLDQSVGRVVRALSDKGIKDRTLILFLSDNGASDKAVGQLDNANVTWRSDGTRTRVGNRPDIQPGPADNFVTAGPAWSSLANTPFREHKQTNFEGGIASPLVAWWPRMIRKPGSVNPELSHITDITATVLDVAGVEYPVEFDNRRITPIAGRSLFPVLRGGVRAGHATLCWSTSGSRAIREGPWKLVARPGGSWELYHLSQDRTELHDLAAEQPERVARMAEIFAEWFANVGRFPTCPE